MGKDTDTMILPLLLALMAPNPHFAAYIGTWDCARPALSNDHHFTLTIAQIGEDKLSLTGLNIFPTDRATRYRTLTRDPDGLWTIDLGLVPYPYSGRETDGTIQFARTPPSRDRLTWRVSDDDRVLQFDAYTTTEFQIDRQEQTVSCNRTSGP